MKTPPSADLKARRLPGGPRAHRRRSIIGAVLAAVLVPFLLMVTACLKAPIGDPEQSKVDPLLTGAWLEKKPGEAAENLWVFQPFDRRAYQVGLFSFKAPTNAPAPATDSKAETDAGRSYMLFKGWLTEIGGKRFLCLEPSFQLSTERGMKPEYWFAFLLPDSLAGDSLTLRMFNGDKAGETTREIEDYIRRNLDNKDLLDEGLTLRRVDRKQYDAWNKRLADSGLQLD